MSKESKPKYSHYFTLDFTFNCDLLGENEEEEALVLQQATEHLQKMVMSDIDLKLDWWGTDYNEDDIQ